MECCWGPGWLQGPPESCVFLGEHLYQPQELPCLSPCLLPCLSWALPGAGMMQELVTGMEKISFDSEPDVEGLGARPLPFLGVDSKLRTGLWHFGG